MRANEFLTEIDRMPADAYTGLTGLRPTTDTGKVKKLPGGSGLLYGVNKQDSYTNIMIWDPKDPEYKKLKGSFTPKEPVQGSVESNRDYLERAAIWDKARKLSGMPGKLVGKLSVYDINNFPLGNAVAVNTIAVSPEYQGKGIAKSLYGIVLTILNKILIAGESQTPGGRRNWVSLSKIPGVELKGYFIMNADLFDSKKTNKKLIDNYLEIIMGELGGNHIGKSGNFEYFAFDVKPNQTNDEIEAEVNTKLSSIYSNRDDGIHVGMYAIWDQNKPEVDEGAKEVAATLAAAGLIGGAGLGGIAAKDAIMGPGKIDQPTAKTIQYTPQSKKAEIPKQLQPQVKQAAKVEPEVKQPIQPKPVTNNPLEKVLRDVALSAGIHGVELAQFLAQCAHESWDFTRMLEHGKNYKRYEPTFKKDPKTNKVVNVNPKAKALGNIKPGDGLKYKGRGFIQLTGRYNYTKAGKELGLPLAEKPELVEKPDIAAQVAVWFWKHRVQPNVDNFNNTKSVTSKINPAMRGLEDRVENFKDYLSTMRKS